MAELSEKAGKTWVLALTSVASFMVALDALVVTTALSTIRLDLGASIEALEWTVNAYNLSFAVLLLTGAALGDRFGRRRMFAAGLALFVVASAACAVASNIGTLIAARAVQGAGAALVMPLAMALLSAVFPREERAKALGIFSAVTGLALIAGPVAGGAIADGLAWQWIFWINLPVGAIAIPLIVRRIRESVGSGTGLDVLGLVLVTAAAMGVMWGLMRGNSVGWMSLEVVVGDHGRDRARCCLRRSGSCASASRWCRCGSSARARLLQGSLRASCSMRRCMAPCSSYRSSCRSRRATDRSVPGLRLLPWTATLFVFAPIGGGLVNRMGERPLVVAGLGLQAIGMAWIALIATPGLAYINLVAPLSLPELGCRWRCRPRRTRSWARSRRARSARPPAPSTCRAFSAACSGWRSRSRYSPRPEISARHRRSAPALFPRSASLQRCR